MSDDGMKYTFTRPGFPPLNITVQIQSDQDMQIIDRVVAYMYEAVEALEIEADLCAKANDSERRGKVVDLITKVRDIQRCAEAIEKP